jgi:hypothetical protein
MRIVERQTRVRWRTAPAVIERRAIVARQTRVVAACAGDRGAAWIADTYACTGCRRSSTSTAIEPITQMTILHHTLERTLHVVARRKVDHRARHAAPATSTTRA